MAGMSGRGVVGETETAEQAGRRSGASERKQTPAVE
jgi:hypothetical protein